jgi:5'-nucleotidase
VIGSVSADITGKTDPAGESSLGDLIADSQLEATRAAASGKAVVAFMNEGGIRADIPFASKAPGVMNGSVTYEEIFNVQPFGNSLVTMTLTGAQLKTLLEEQFEGCGLDFPPAESAGSKTDRVMQVSKGFTYTRNSAGAVCDKVDAASIKINGTSVTPSAKYRVTVNSFMADGGDQLYELKKGADRVGGPQDLDAMKAYFAKHRSVTPTQPNRISIKP